MKFLVTYKDVIEANSEEEARERLIRVLESDVACKDVDSFEFTNLNDYEQAGELTLVEKE